MPLVLWEPRPLAHLTRNQQETTQPYPFTTLRGLWKRFMRVSTTWCFVSIICVSVARESHLYYCTVILPKLSLSSLSASFPADSAVPVAAVLPEQGCAINSGAICVCGAGPWAAGEITSMSPLGSISCLLLCVCPREVKEWGIVAFSGSVAVHHIILCVCHFSWRRVERSQKPWLR